MKVRCNLLQFHLISSIILCCMIPAFSQSGKGNTTIEKPGGTILFLSTRDGNFEIYSMDAMGGNQKNLTNHPKMDFWISCDQERGLVYFYSTRSGNAEICFTDIHGGEAGSKTNHKATDTNPQVSPDGLTLLFHSDRDHPSGEIYTMNLLTSAVTRITRNDAHEDVAAWSPDGKTIVFSKDARDPLSEQESNDGDYELFSIKPDGSGEKQLTHFPGFISGPSFSPDGKKIAVYGRGSDGLLDLFLMKPNGKSVVNITNDSLEQYSPSWSPDGQWIAYTGGDKSNYDVWILHLESGQRFRLTDNAKRDESPVWIK